MPLINFVARNYETKIAVFDGTSPNPELSAFLLGTGQCLGYFGKSEEDVKMNACYACPFCGRGYSMDLDGIETGGFSSCGFVNWINPNELVMQTNQHNGCLHCHRV